MNLVLENRLVVRGEELDAFWKAKTISEDNPITMENQRRDKVYSLTADVEPNYRLKNQYTAHLWLLNKYPGAKIIRTRHQRRQVGEGYAISFTLRYWKDVGRASGRV